MVKRTVLSLIFAVIILIVGGVVELIVLTNGFSELQGRLKEMLVEADNETIDEVKFQAVINYWEELRPKAECIVTHSDLNEINLRINECMSFIHNEDYGQAYMQIEVLLFLSDYIPKLLVPSVTTIL